MGTLDNSVMSSGCHENQDSKAWYRQWNAGNEHGDDMVLLVEQHEIKPYLILSYEIGAIIMQEK